MDVEHLCEAKRRKKGVMSYAQGSLLQIFDSPRERYILVRIILVIISRWAN